MSEPKEGTLPSVVPFAIVAGWQVVRVTEGIRTLTSCFTGKCAQTEYTTDTARNGSPTVVGSRRLINECDVTHCKRFVFCVHHDLVPSVQNDRLVIRMTYSSTNEHTWVSSLSHPVQVTKFRSTTYHLSTLDLGHTAGVLVADVNQLSSLPNDLFAHMRLSTATCNWLVSESQSLIDEARVLDGNEEPFTLTDERLITSTISLSRLMFVMARSGFSRK